MAMAETSWLAERARDLRRLDGTRDNLRVLVFSALPAHREV
jgi:hypothetical protein